LDWPDRNERAPFTNEYFSGWRYGRSGPPERPVNYNCGALLQLGFASGPVFAGVEFDPRLQLADLIVGASKEFVNFALSKIPKESFGVQTFKLLMPSLFQRKSGQNLGLGFTASPAQSDFSKKILDGLKLLK
jgi:hypothetical protein